jgi:addiction module HigA family antidote
MVNKLTMATKNEYIPQTVTHPGVTLGAKIQELQIGVKDFAVHANLPESVISAIVNGKASITADLAVALEKATNIPAHFWLARQKNYDDYQLEVSTSKSRACAYNYDGILMTKKTD